MRKLVIQFYQRIIYTVSRIDKRRFCRGWNCTNGKGVRNPYLSFRIYRYLNLHTLRNCPFIEKVINAEKAGAAIASEIMIMYNLKKKHFQLWLILRVEAMISLTWFVVYDLWIVFIDAFLFIYRLAMELQGKPISQLHGFREHRDGGSGIPCFMRRPQFMWRFLWITPIVLWGKHTHKNLHGKLILNGNALNEIEISRELWWSTSKWLASSNTGNPFL